MFDCLFLFLLQDRYDKGEDLSERAIVKLIFYSAPELSLRPKTTEVYELPNVRFTCVVIQTICFKISLSCCIIMLCTSQFQSCQDLSVFFGSLYINLFIKLDIFSFKLLCQVGLVVSVSTSHTVQPDCLNGRVVCATVYGDMHLKDLLGSIARVESRIFI